MREHPFIIFQNANFRNFMIHFRWIKHGDFLYISIVVYDITVLRWNNSICRDFIPCTINDYHFLLNFLLTISHPSIVWPLFRRRTLEKKNRAKYSLFLLRNKIIKYHYSGCTKFFTAFWKIKRLKFIWIQNSLIY